MKKTTLQLVLLIALTLGFVWLATRVFMTRFESGDLYPRYSTFRPDPFGSRVLLKTFNQLGGLSVDVASDPVLFELETGGEGRVLFVLGLPVWDRFFPFKASDTLDRLANDGAAVVVALAVAPAGLGAIEEERAEEAEEVDETEEENEKVEDVEGELAAETTDVERWMSSQSIGFYVIDRELLNGIESEERIVANPSVGYLQAPLELSQPIGLEFKDGGEWRSLYEYEGNVVAAERRMGKGRMILFSDTYPFSNEGILNSANHELFAWLIKDRQRVTFYESHLGVETYYGLIALARLYGFDAVLILFLVASAAFVWRGSFSPLPKEDSMDGESGLIDIDAIDSGLNGLLVRSIDRPSLGPAIYGRWKKSFAGQRLSKEKNDRIVEALQTYKSSEMKPDDLTGFYNTTVSILEVKGIKESE